jgi:uncharacterized protein YxeA
MKKILLGAIIICVIIVGVVFSQMLIKTINYNNRVDIDGASHIIVVVVDPTSVSGGTKIIDETYSLTGSSSTINASIFVEVK